MSDKLTDLEAQDLGVQIREAQDHNLLVGSFAAEMIGESYPLPSSMWPIVFNGFNDTQLGHKFASWMDNANPR